MPNEFDRGPAWPKHDDPREVWLVVGRAPESNRRLIALPEVQNCRVAPGATNVELSWLGRANLTARVVDGDANPIQDFAAELRYLRSDDMLWILDSKPTILGDGKIGLHDFPLWDSQLGYWETELKIVLRLKGPGFHRHDVEIQDHLKRGEHVDYGDIVLEQPPVLRIRVVAHDGNPLSGARVYMSAGQSNELVSMAYAGEELPTLGDYWGDPEYLYGETNEMGVAVLPALSGLDAPASLAVHHPNAAFLLTYEGPRLHVGGIVTFNLT